VSLQATNIGEEQNQYPNCGNPDPSKKPAYCKCEPSFAFQQQVALTVDAIAAASAMQHRRALHYCQYMTSRLADATGTDIPSCPGAAASELFVSRLPLPLTVTLLYCVASCSVGAGMAALVNRPNLGADVCCCRFTCATGTQCACNFNDCTW
jgi:hypothetical protein